MAVFNYASPNTGLLSGAIGWINLGTGTNVVTINSGSSLTNQTATLRDGSVFTFSVSLINIYGEVLNYKTSLPLTNVGGFGNIGFTGINAPVRIGNAVNTAQTSTSNRFTFYNMSLVDSFGVAVPNFYFYVVEGDTSTSTNEFNSFTTDGSAWSLFTNIGTGSNPTVHGMGGTGADFTGSASTSYYSPMIVTKNPTSIVWYYVSNGSSGTNCGIAFGVSVNKISLRQELPNRMSFSDQFTLNVNGNINATTTTFGNTTGLQSVSSYVFPTSVGMTTVTLSYSMAPNSFSTIPCYASTVALTNITPGGTVVPSSVTLPKALSLAEGDIILATITSTGVFTNSSISNTKIAPSFAGVNDVLTYTLAYNNIGCTLNNVVLRDTIPSGTTFVPNSLKLNGATITGSPAPPSGIILPTIPFGLSTLTFDVNISTIPTINPLNNIASTAFNYQLLTGTISSSINSNATSTRVDNITLLLSKFVDKNFAALDEIITYSIPITNIGNITASNILLIDTIPNSTSLINNALTQDGITLPGGSLSSGIILNNIGAGKTSTVSFKVVVKGLPSINPVSNIARTSVTYTVNPSISRTNTQIVDTNSVSTQINYASFAGITKIVDKTSTYIGDTLTYTIVVPNSGNVTAVNAIFVDSTPNGMSFVPNSVTVDGTTLSGISPSSGIPLPNIGPGSVLTINFKALVSG